MLHLALLSLVGLGPLTGVGSSQAADVQDGAVAAAEASAPLLPLGLDRGAGLAPFHAPRDEELTFRVHVDVTLLEAALGTVTLSSSVEPYAKGVLGDGDEEAEGEEVAVFRCRAKGDYELYSMDAVIETRVLPSDDPRLTYRYTHEGTERRRREIQLSVEDGEFISSYRSDTSKGAPKGKRIWKQRESRTIPEGTLDMLSAVYFARELIERDLESLAFPLIDKHRIWQMDLSRGGEKRLELPCGVFDAVEIVLQPSPYPGEEIDPEKVAKFEGLFGIQGSIHLWVEQNSGVPLRIQGSFPAGPVTLGVDVVLQQATGTPASFVAIRTTPEDGE